MEKKLNIIVIENNPVSCEAAKQQLAEHNVTIVNSYKEFDKIIRKNPNEIEKLVECDLVLADATLGLGDGFFHVDTSMGWVYIRVDYPAIHLANRLKISGIALISEANELPSFLKTHPECAAKIPLGVFLENIMEKEGEGSYKSKNTKALILLEKDLPVAFNGEQEKVRNWRGALRMLLS